jgi:hypothetical protein
VLYRIALPVVRVFGIGLIGSTFLPWYSAYSGRALCARLVLPYIDTAEQDPVLLTRPCHLQDGMLVDLWVFKERAAMLLVVGILAVLVASRIPGSVQRPLLAVLPIVTLGTIAAILADQPGFGEEIGDLYFVRWGGWVSFACCLGIAVGCALALARSDRRDQGEVPNVRGRAVA